MQSVEKHKNLGKYLIDHNININSEIAEIYLNSNKLSEAFNYLKIAKTNLNIKEFNSSALHYYEVLAKYYKISKTGVVHYLNCLDSLNYYRGVVNKELDINEKVSNEAKFAYAKQYSQTLLAIEKYKKTKLLFFAAIVGLILSIVITILYIKRKNLHQKMQQQKIVQKNELANKALKQAQTMLNDFAKNIQQKNNLIDFFTEEIEKLKIENNFKQNYNKEEFVEKLKTSVILTEGDWINYKSLFEKAYPDFINKVKDQFPSLTQGELRYLMFTKINLNNKEMASIMGISIEAVRNLKFRVKQKIGENNLFDVIS